jgi:hypothetical protein
VKEAWLRALSDDTEGCGISTDTPVALLESGDKIFGRWEGITQTTVNAGGSIVTNASSVRTLTGATGKFKRVAFAARRVGSAQLISRRRAALLKASIGLTVKR